MMCSVLHVKPAMSLPVPLAHFTNTCRMHLANHYNSIWKEKHVNGRETKKKKKCVQHTKNGRKGGLRNKS